jgi:hypothetical protein
VGDRALLLALLSELHCTHHGYAHRTYRNIYFRVVRGVDHFLLRLNRFVLNVERRELLVDGVHRNFTADDAKMQERFRDFDQGARTRHG